MENWSLQMVRDLFYFMIITDFILRNAPVVNESQNFFWISPPLLFEKLQNITIYRGLKFVTKKFGENLNYKTRITLSDTHLSAIRESDIPNMPKYKVIDKQLWRSKILTNIN